VRLVGMKLPLLCAGYRLRQREANMKLHMRTKKALKQLSKAEALISTVASRYAPSDSHLHELLGSASTILGRAKEVLDNRSGPSPRKSAQATRKGSQPQGSETGVTPEFVGNKTDFVRAVVEARGRSGATPGDIDQAFTTRRIERSRNLIYTALSALVKQKKLKKKDGRYFSSSIDSNVKSVQPKKRISPEGLKRIIEATKRRWAEKKAAQRNQAATGLKKSSVGKRKAVVGRNTGKRFRPKRAASKTRV
jgi:hypothetical protein